MKNKLFKNSEINNKTFMNLVRKSLNGFVEEMKPSKINIDNEAYFRNDRVEVVCRAHDGLYSLRVLYHGSTPRHLTDNGLDVHKDDIFQSCNTSNLKYILETEIKPHLKNIVIDSLVYDLDDENLDMFTGTMKYLDEIDIDITINTLKGRIKSFNSGTLKMIGITKSDNDVAERLLKYYESLE